MLSSVSWTQYFTAILIASSIYYLYVWGVYFKAKLPSGVGLLKTPSSYAEDQPDEQLTTTQHIINELRPLFINKQNKNELILALQLELKQYTEWDEPEFRASINEFITSESLSKCSIRLGEEDQRVIWLQAMEQ